LLPGQARRVAARFALVATVSELTTRLGGTGNLEEGATVNHLQAIIKRFGKNCFTHWDAIAVKTDAHAHAPATD
jgi:hypothetical protein